MELELIATWTMSSIWREKKDAEIHLLLLRMGLLSRSRVQYAERKGKRERINRREDVVPRRFHCRCLSIRQFQLQCLPNTAPVINLLLHLVFEKL